MTNPYAPTSRSGDREQIRPVDVEFLVASGLLAALDRDIIARYPDAPVNGINTLEFEATNGYAVVASVGEEPIGCGAFRPMTQTTVEIKRMFVRQAYRGQGIAGRILAALETEARRRGYSEAILETGSLQPEAIALYRRCGYQEIPPYGPYVGNAHSVCFKKIL